MHGSLKACWDEAVKVSTSVATYGHSKICWRDLKSDSKSLEAVEAFEIVTGVSATSGCHGARR